MTGPSQTLFAPRGQPQSRVESLPFISVIVPVRNEAAFIGRTLDQLLGQNYDADRFEVIVADGRSADDTREIVRGFQRRYANLLLLDNPKRWSSAGRNAAVRAARGEIIALVDGHCELGGADYLLNLADAFARSGADCIGRPQPLDVAAATPLQRAIAAARASSLGHHPGSHIYSTEEQFVPPHSVAIAYRRSDFERVGLFDEKFDACEDVEFNHRVHRAGCRCFFTPAVRVRYHPRTTFSGVFRQMVRYGRGRVRLLSKHPETFSVVCFLPAMFLLGLVVGSVVAWLSVWLALAYGSVIGLYAATVLGVSVALSLRARDVHLLPRLPLVFATIHFGAGAGVLLEALAGASRKPAFWRKQPVTASLRRAA